MLIELPLKVVKDLVLAHAELRALEAGGVDNWDWYCDSLNDEKFWEFEEEVRSKDGHKKVTEYLKGLK